jgi:hypothetical protein
LPFSEYKAAKQNNRTVISVLISVLGKTGRWGDGERGSREKSKARSVLSEAKDLSQKSKVNTSAFCLLPPAFSLLPFKT